MTLNYKENHLTQQQVEDMVETIKPLSRKSFLIKTALAAYLLSNPLMAKEHQEKLPSGIKNMNINQYLVFKRVTEVMLPVAGTEFTPLEKVPFMQNIDNYLGDLPAHFCADFLVGVGLFKYASIIIGFNFTTFTNLNDKSALAYCYSWQSGFGFQQALLNGFKKFVIGAYWSDESTWPPLNYLGPVTKKYKIPRLGNAKRLV